MAALDEGTLDLCSLARHHGVDQLHTTVLSGGNKYLVWTRLSNENSSWILNVSDGIDVWRTELDKEQLDTHREFAELDKYDAYFEKFRSEFMLYNVTLAPFANKMTLTVGLEMQPLIYDLYEAKASEKKTEMQILMFRLADTVAELTEKLNVSEESLERLKSQKESAAVSTAVFEPANKKPAVASVKRKQGHSLINPGSRNVAVQMEGTVPADGSTAHMSILSDGRTLDIYKCTDFNCSFGCLNSSKRYHCPLCDNKPQKPGRMRRHFTKMHAGKQLVQHEGYQMLRCKLRCSRSNGRVAENSHYHCCLCGRVCLRKVHLFCHLQAHSLGTQHEIDEEMMVDGEKDEEELDETDVVEDEDDMEDSSALESSQIQALTSTQSENVVALTDGTQVVYVQSIQDGDTLTVMPLEGQTGDLQLSQHQPSTSAASSAQDLSTLQLLTSVAGTSTMADISTAGIHQGLGIGQDSSALFKQVEALLNQGEQNVSLPPQETSSDSVLPQQEQVATLPVFDTGDTMSNLPPSTSHDSIQSIHPTAAQSQELQHPAKEDSDLCGATKAGHQDVDTEEPMEFETSLTSISPTKDGTPAFSQVTLGETNTTAELVGNRGDGVMSSVGEIVDETAPQMATAQFESSTAIPTSHVANQMVTVTSISDGRQLVPAPPVQIANISSENHLGNHLQLQSTAVATPTCVTAAVTQNSEAAVTVTPSTRTSPAKPVTRKPKASEQDLLVLLETSKSDEEDDKIFQLLGWKDHPRKETFFKHVSIMTDKNSLDTKRCRNTDCDCRLYHCPLCTCLPNKPGRIKEHFKKIHSTDFIIRYQGTQMLRCKLGCSRPSGKKVMNSHYHCCLCGTICMRKASVYEHMRAQHMECGDKPGPGRPPMVPGKTDRSSQGDQQRLTTSEQASKTVAETPVQVQAPKPMVVQIPSFAQANQGVDTSINTAPQVQMMGAIQGGQQQVTLQIPQMSDGSQGGHQQQLVILMPQQQVQGVTPTQPVQATPQPIVILMPQAGGQAAQSVVVPVPQVSAT